MTEKDAKKVADWLDGNRQVPLDKAIQEAIVAIRPDLAPDPTLSIDEILAGVEKGPLSESEVESSSDESFVAAVFQTRNANPKTSIDDILNVVQEGPLAKSQNTQTNVVALRSWWTRPSVGVLAAAAVAIVVLLPSRFMVPEYSEQASEVEVFQEVIENPSVERSAQPEEVAEEPSTLIKEERRPSPREKRARGSTMSKKSSGSAQVERTAPINRLQAPPPPASARKAFDDVQGTPAPAETAKSAPQPFDESRLQIVEEQTSRKVRRKSALKRRSDGAPVTDEMEEALPPSAVEKQPWFGTLGLRISADEKVQLQEATDTSVAMDLCSGEDPTKSLDVLWYAAQFQNASDALKLLLSSEAYQDGDKRYLARNYYVLGDLYTALGQEEKARKYYRLASELR